VVSRPALFERLGASARVTVISAAAGSGKTVLLQSWIHAVDLADSVAWVSVGRDERDPQQFWLAVVRSLRETKAGSELVRAVSAAPDLDGWALLERLLIDLAPLEDRLWLVIDDVHELGSEVLQELALLLMRAPPQLNFVFATRHDVRLGLHRLRLQGELTEIRASDLKFTQHEAHELMAAAGVDLPESVLMMLLERTEGWAAGLRLAALSLAGHPDPEGFAADFSGGERTVAEYLLAEVLERQSEQVRRMLLRTSVLMQVNGELADLLTGSSASERVLQDLEQANAFVIALDPGQSWFRYHRLFSDLLQRELRRTAPEEVTGLHRQAAEWLAGHGDPVSAIHHAQAAQDWELAARLLSDHWPGLHLAGQDTTNHQLLTGFPAETLMADAELAVLSALDELRHGSLETAEWYIGLAERASSSVLVERQGQAALLLGIARLLQARKRGNLATVAEEARRLQAIADTRGITQRALGEDLRALALICLGSAEWWANQLVEAERHLDAGVALAHRIGRPYLEFTGLAYQAGVGQFESFAAKAERGMQAVELAQRHGWTDDPAFGFASLSVGTVLVAQGRFEEAEPWLQRAERVLRAEAEPTEAMAVRMTRGMLEIGRGRYLDALATLEAADRLAGRLAEPSLVFLPIRTMLVQTLVRLGETERAEQALAELDDQDQNSVLMRMGLAVLRLGQNKPEEAISALAPALDGSVPRPWPGQPALSVREVVTWGGVFLLESIAQYALGESLAAGSALERALDLAEPSGALEIFLRYPAPDLLERHARQGTAHASLVADILSLLAGRQVERHIARPQAPLEALSNSEIRVLRYLPTNLTAPEIARELYVSPSTVKTHIRNLYAKLGTHRRAAAVESARALGLLAPSGAGSTQVTEPPPR
jgi:LuxR family maltose regulon positive regulatory protein